MTAKIPLFRELSAQAVLIIVFFKKKCRLVGETGRKLLDELEVKFLFHLVEHKMPYVAVGMALAPTPKNFSAHVTFLIFLQLIWQNDPDMRDQREGEQVGDDILKKPRFTSPQIQTCSYPSMFMS